MMRSSTDDDSFVSGSTETNDVVTVPSNSSRPPWTRGGGSTTNSSVLSSTSTTVSRTEDDQDIISTTVAAAAAAFPMDDDRFHMMSSIHTRKSSMSGMQWFQQVAGDVTKEQDTIFPGTVSHPQQQSSGGAMLARLSSSNTKSCTSTQKQQPLQQPGSSIPFPATLEVKMTDSISSCSTGPHEQREGSTTKHHHLSGPLFGRNPDIVHRSMARGSRMAADEAFSVVDRRKSMGDSTMSSGPVFEQIWRDDKGDEQSDSQASIGTDMENQVISTLDNNFSARRTKLIFAFLLFLFLASVTFATGACFYVGRCGDRSTSSAASTNTRGQAIDEEAALGNGSTNSSIPTLSPRAAPPGFPTPLPTFLAPYNLVTNPPMNPMWPGKEPQRVPGDSATRKPSTSVGLPVLDDIPTVLPTTMNPTTLVPTIGPTTLFPTMNPPRLPTNEPALEAIRINVGSTVPLTDAQGLQWQEDILSIGTEFQDDSCSSGSIYCSNRWFSDDNSANMFGAYTIEIPVSFQAIYRVRLHFAELFHQTPGSRIFDVHVEGTLIADNLDVFAEVGGKSPYILEVELVPCLDGALSIELLRQNENPFINAIEVVYESPFRLIVRTQDHLFQAVDDYLAGTLQLPINDWDVSMVANFSEAFSVDRNTAVASFNEDLDRWNMSRAQSLAGMFRGAAAFNGNVSTWQTSRVTNLQFTFDGATSFNGDLSRWDTSSCKSFYGMFRGAESFNAPLTDWNTGRVLDMGRMFLDCKAFNQPLFWSTSNVKSFVAMFEGTESFADASGSLSGWDMSNARSVFRMFASSSFRGDVSSWAVQNVRDFRYMFDNNAEFESDLSGWRTNEARQMEGMFRGATKFNSPSVVSFNVSQVSIFRDMFAGAASFNIDLCSWGTQLLNVTSNLDFTNMFVGTSCPFQQSPTIEAGPWCQTCA